MSEWLGKLPLANFRRILGSNMHDIFLMKRMEIPKIQLSFKCKNVQSECFNHNNIRVPHEEQLRKVKDKGGKKARAQPRSTLED